MSRKAIRHIVSVGAAAAAVCGALPGLVGGAQAADAATAPAAQGAGAGSKSGWIALETPAGALQLISPAGVRSTVTTTIPHADRMRLVDASADGRRFLFADFQGSVQVYDVTTARWRTVMIEDTAQVRLSRPGGSAILSLSPDGGDGRIRLLRWGVDGSFQRELPYHTSIFGEVNVLPSADGMTYLSPGRSGGVDIRNNATGAYAGTLGKSLGACTPVRWWNDATLTAACSATGDYMAQDVYRIPLNGATPVRLTKHENEVVGLDWAQATASGKIVAKHVPTCGPASFGVLDARGLVSTVTLPKERTPNLLGVSGDRMVIESMPGCGDPGPSSLMTKDVRTGVNTWLGAMDSAIVIDARG